MDETQHQTGAADPASEQPETRRGPEAPAAIVARLLANPRRVRRD